MAPPPQPRAAASLTPVGGRNRGLWVGLDHASIMGTELMAAILIWTAIGWWADGWLGTTPWLLVAGALLGNAAGLYLIWLRSGRMEAAERRDVDRVPAADGSRA
jgi:F0F1-type ATP synthase assembly protein I